MSRLGAPVALCISGLLVLSACDSSKSASAAGDTKAAASATSSPAASGTPESVRIGPYTQVFATLLPTNPAQAKVMEGFREAQILWEKSDNAWHLVAPVTDYVTGHALTHLVAAMTAGKARESCARRDGSLLHDPRHGHHRPQSNGDHLRRREQVQGREPPHRTSQRRVCASTRSGIHLRDVAYGPAVGTLGYHRLLPGHPPRPPRGALPAMISCRA